MQNGVLKVEEKAIRNLSLMTRICRNWKTIHIWSACGGFEREFLRVFLLNEIEGVTYRQREKKVGKPDFEMFPFPAETQLYVIRFVFFPDSISQYCWGGISILRDTRLARQL